MSSSSSTAIERYGLTEVFTCEHPVADVVFVHGLNGDPERTWTSQNTGKFWPRDFLPNDLDGKARILVYGYDADVVAWGSNGGVGKDMIHNHSERLVATLVANRRRQHAEERPLIFVAHSLGGLVVKRALVYSSEIRVGTRTERLRSVFLSTYGILFLGTPHHGSDIAVWGSYLERLAGVVIPKRLMDSSHQLVDALKSNSETLINIDRQFSTIMPLFHIYLFHESKKTDVKGTLAYIVSEESAAPTLPDVERSSIPADHSHMCKFDNDRSAGYDIVSDAISYYVEDAESSHSVAGRWVKEKQVRRIGQSHAHLTEGYGSPQPEISEPSSRGSSPAPTAGSSIKLLPSGETSYVRLPQLLEGAPPEPFFFAPPGFRPNSYFVGMKKQLAELDEHLFDRSLRQQGTAAVLIHGPPGSGKSHLAREYIFKHKTKFKGGIFWINARYFDELCKDLWQLAQKFVARDSPNIRIEPSGNGKEFISAVREWFSSRTEWLIVLDGVTVDNRVQVEQLQRLIPDSKDSSLIYTSRSSQFHASQRLLHPRPVRVPRLSEKEGQDLIFKELNVKRTKSNEKAAVELVKKVGGLPLAIHAISVRLAETHEPLERYSPRSYAEDPRIGVPYHEILQALYNDHREAYNLMNILAFFGPHIPVELVILGLKAAYSKRMEVRTRASQYEAPDINTSFSVLMRHALVDRNEPEDTDSATSSRSSLLEPEPIDILRLHTVVQKFCRDRLSSDSREDIAHWISLAASVLQQSYQEAHNRMDDRGPDHPPRVSDFREYLVHAERMKEHALEFEPKHQELHALRTEIEQLIARINAEIHDREPSSSQESVIRHYAVSIFDRTSSTSSSDEPPITPGYRPLPETQTILWNQDVLPSPMEYRAIDMLRNLSNNTIRSEQVIVDDFEVLKEPQHSRTGSRPGFSQGYFVPAMPAYAQPEVYNDHVEGAIANAPMNREGNMSGSSRAVMGLTELYRNSPPPARGGGFISSRKSTPPAAEPTLFSPPDALGRSSRPSYTRTLTQRRAAEPQLTRPRYAPNPLAEEFVPSSWPRYNVAAPAWGNWQNWEASGQNPNTASNFAMAQNPAYWQARTSLPSNSIDANLHASSGQAVLLEPAPQPAHHVRASSVPDIPYHPTSGQYMNDLSYQTDANLSSSVIGYSPSNMTRDPSSNSHSSGSGITAFQAPSVPQYTSPFISPSHPLAQVATPTPPNSSPHARISRSSPLQTMQTSELAQSTGSISPVTIGQVYQHPSPPLLGANGQPVLIASSPPNAVQSAPATTMFPPPPGSPNTLTSYRATPPRPSTIDPNASAFVAAQSMSRTSSGNGPGPGVVISSPSYGLGIAEFPTNGAQPVIRFGQQDPVDVAEAQRRAELHRRQLDRERRNLIDAQREAQRRTAMLRGGQPGQPFGIQSEILPSPSVGGAWAVPVTREMGFSMAQLTSGVAVPTLVAQAPYPPVNMMPSASDNQVLQAMIEQNVAYQQGLARRLDQVPGGPLQQAQDPQAVFEQGTGGSRSRGFSEPTREGWPAPPTRDG